MIGSGFGVLRAPGTLEFGRGARRAVPRAVAALGRRALVVVDPVLASSVEFLEALDGIRSAGVEVHLHTDVQPELPIDSVVRAAEGARPIAPEVILGWGGGSALDLAKLVSLLLSHDGPPSRFYGENRVPGPVLPVVAVPTTAGTGSECTPVAVLADPDRELKVGVSDPALVPAVAIVDPELGVGAPPRVTAHAGIDAIVHAVESYTAAEREPSWDATLPVFVGRNRLGSLLGLEALTAMVTALPRAVEDGHDLDAREAMAWGSTLAGLAFGSAGTHLSHALQYPIGALSRTPHGLGTGLLLPYVLEACLPAVAGRLAELAPGLGVATGDRDVDARAVIEAIADVVAAIGIPSSLAEIGIRVEDAPRIAELASGVTRLAGNATVPGDLATLQRIVEAAWVGDRRLAASR